MEQNIHLTRVSLTSQININIHDFLMFIEIGIFPAHSNHDLTTTKSP